MPARTKVRLAELHEKVFAVVGVAAVIAFLVHIYVAFLQPEYSFVDDQTYLGAAVDIIRGIRCPPVAGTVCNYEHPPLSKLLMAVGFDIFGRTQIIGSGKGAAANQIGPRFFQMMMQSFSAPLLYVVINKMTGNWKMAFLSAIFLLVDPLYFTISSSALLDGPMLFFSLAALLPYVYAAKLGKTKAYALTGALFGLSLLSKETAVFFVGAFFCYGLVAGEGTLRSRLWMDAQVAIFGALVFLVGLQLYDTALTPFPTAFAQLEMMATFHFGAGAGQLAYLSGVSSCSNIPGLCPSNRSLEPHFLYTAIPLTPVMAPNCVACWTSTNPLDWLTYFPPVIFPQNLVLAPNYALVWLAFAWVPLSVWKFPTLRATGEGRAAILALFIFGWNVLSNIYLFEGVGRAAFEWYMLPAVPGLAIGAAFLLTRPRVPKLLVFAVAGAVILVGLLLNPATFQLMSPQSQVCLSC
jgi:4-amino-4-deoxy-L-arabinose transferase-like glycosyltransferase